MSYNASISHVGSSRADMAGVSEDCAGAVLKASMYPNFIQKFKNDPRLKTRLNASGLNLSSIEKRELMWT